MNKFYAILEDSCLKTYDYNKKLVFKNQSTALKHYNSIPSYQKQCSKWELVELTVTDVIKND